MVFKFVAFAAFLAVARAGGPAAYDIATASGDHSSIGISQESTQKGYAGQNVISSYSRAEDSAHSSVRVSSHSISNDALLNYDISHAPIVKTAYADSAYIAPTATPLIAKTYAAPYSYSAPAPILTKAYAAPAPLLTKAYAAPAPLLTKAYAAPAPLLAKTYATPYSYAAAAPLVAKTYATPYSYAAPESLLAKTYSAPYSYAAPESLLAKTYTSPYSYAAPAASLLTKTYAAQAAPLLAKSYLAPAAPLLAKSYEYAAHAPVVTKSALIASAHGYTAAIAPAPLLAKTYSAPLVTKAPLLDYAPQAHIISKTLEPTAPIVHTVFNGLGTSYACNFE